MNLQTHTCVFATARLLQAFTRTFSTTLSALLLLAAPAAWAQAADETYELSIASQPLQGALMEFSQATDIQVLLPGGSVSAGTGRGVINRIMILMNNVVGRPWPPIPSAACAQCFVVAFWRIVSGGKPARLR